MLLFLLTGCLATPSDDPVTVFDAVWSDFDAMYGGFHQRQVDWDEAYDTWSPEVGPDATDDQLYDAVTGMVAELDDAHIRVAAPDREVFWSNHVYQNKEMAGTFDEEVVRTYLTDVDTGPWDWYLRGELSPGVAYVWFPGIDDNTWVLETITEENPESLIIDLRHSHGGATTFSLRGLAPLTAEEFPVLRTRSRNGPGRDDYDAWFTWTQPAGKTYWGGDIYVLVDGETVSASERVLLALKAMPNVSTIGVASNGSLATSIAREAPNGWTYTMPVQEVERVDGTVDEGVGIPVDIEMLNDPADVANGRDEVLEYALGLAVAAR